MNLDNMTLGQMKEKLREVMIERQRQREILDFLEEAMLPIVKREWDIKTKILETFPLRTFVDRYDNAHAAVARYTRAGQAERRVLYQELNSVQLPKEVCKLRKDYREAKRLDAVMRDEIRDLTWAIEHPKPPPKPRILRPAKPSKKQGMLFDD